MSTTAQNTNTSESPPQSDSVSSATRDFKYRPDVDGLRALAVTLVLLFHAGLGFSGGFIGVDVFFVISGFLITGLVLKQLDAGTFSLKNFWVRRIRRILPASTAMVLLVLAAGYFLLLSPEFKQLAESAIAQQLMLSNVYFWRNTGYFDGPAELKPLLHTWSLGVEEQFYIGYPILLMLLHRFFRRGTFAVLILLAVASLALSQYAVTRSPSATFYLLPTRAWELLLGGLICFLPRLSAINPRVLSVCSWISFAAIFMTGWFYTAEIPFPGLTALVPCIAATALIYVNSERLTGPARALASRPVVFVGLISYSLYLWHWPLFALFRYWIGEPSVVASLALLAASFGLGVLSWRFVETPIRQLKPGIPAYGYFSAAMVSICSVLVVSSVIIANEGFPGKFPEQGYTDRAPRTFVDLELEDLEADRLPIIGDRRNNRPSILCWGDSHLEAVIPALENSFENHEVSAFVAKRRGTAPLLDVWRIGDTSSGRREMSDWKSGVIRFIEQNDVSDVLLVARWTIGIEGELNGKTGEVISDMQAKPGDVEEASRAVERGLVRTVETLQSLRVRVWIVKQVPLQIQDPNKQIVASQVFGVGTTRGTSAEWNEKRHRRANEIIDGLRDRGVIVLDPLPYCTDEDGFSKIFDGTQSLYRDDDHLAKYGSKVLLGDMFEEFAKELKRDSERN